MGDYLPLTQFIYQAQIIQETTMTPTQLSYISGIQGNLADCLKILKDNIDPATFARIEPMMIISYGMLNELQNDNQATMKNPIDPVKLSHDLISQDLETIIQKLRTANLLGDDQDELLPHLWETLDLYIGEYCRR
jgi:hypothetical protein